MSTQSPSLSILWRQVWGLAIMLATILFSFMIYGVYQPKVLTALGFAGLASHWNIWAGCLGAVVEPGLGRLSDVILTKTGSRLPQITVGITIAGLLFVVIAWLIPTVPPLSFRWLLLIMMCVWLIAMVAVRGPVVALLRQFAPVSELPIANEVLVLVIGLTSAIAPVLEDLLKSMQASIAFMSGAIALLVGATILYKTLPRPASFSPLSASEIEGATVPLRSPRQLSLMLIIGMATGCLLNVLMTVMPRVLHLTLPAISPNVMMSIALVIAAISANPFGWLSQRWGPARGLQVGLGAVTGVLALATLSFPGFVAILVLVVAGAAMGLVIISMVPLALSYVPIQQVGLSTGLFFGGSGAGTALVLYWNQDIATLTPLAGFGMGAIVFSLATFCLSMIQMPKSRQ
jgi:hypothetical protein